MHSRNLLIIATTLTLAFVSKSPLSADTCWNVLPISACSRSAVLPFFTDPFGNVCMPREWTNPNMTDHCIGDPNGWTDCDNNVPYPNGCMYELPVNCVPPQTWSGVPSYQNSLAAQLSGASCEG